MDDLLRHPVVATVLAAVVVALLAYIADKARKLSKVPDQVDTLDKRLTAHLAEETEDNKRHAAAVEGLHRRVDAVLFHLTGTVPDRE